MKNTFLIYILLILSNISFGQESTPASLKIDGVTQKRVDKYTKVYKLRKRFGVESLGNVSATVRSQDKVISRMVSDQEGNYKLNFDITPNRDYSITFVGKGHYKKVFTLNTNGMSPTKQIQFKGWDFALFKRIIGLSDSVFVQPTRFYYDTERGFMTYDEKHNLELEISQDKIYFEYLNNLNEGNLTFNEDIKEVKSYSIDNESDTTNDNFQINSNAETLPNIQLLDMKKLLSELSVSTNSQDSLIKNKQTEISNEWQQLEIAKIKATTEDDKTKIREAQKMLLEKEQQIKSAQNEIVNAKKKIELQALENKNKTTLLTFAAAVLLLVLTLLFVVFKNNKERLKSNQLLTVKNKEVMDSIKYAQRLQNAILPPLSVINKNLSDSFILYKPKDIVSGDFYWVQNIGGTTYFAVVDCTGHGVPGAFMSIVGYNALNQAINQHKLRKPSDILNQVNREISKTLHQADNIDIEDGMDISLCMLDTKTNELEYAGAVNGLNILRKGELKIIKGDKFSIGSTKRNGREYSNHNFKLEKGDYIYIYSDGYADQFGGSKERKFMYKKLRQLLVDNSMLTTKQQKENLEKQFNVWKGDLEQIDDVCIMGVKIA